jgi:DNA repair protein RadC
MNTTESFPGFESLVKPFKFAAGPYEYKVTSLRECPTPENLQQCETPDKAADYWRMHIASHPHFNPDCECLAVLLLNTRRRVKGHHLVSIGTMDTILVHPREVFRLAIVTAASALIVMHNHPSGVIPHPVLCRKRVEFASATCN